MKILVLSLICLFWHLEGLSFSITNITVLPHQSIRSVSLVHLLKKYQIQKIELVMGHLTSQVSVSPFPQGIITHIHSLRALEDGQISQLAAAFGVSTNTNFMIEDQSIGRFTIADPNDKLCNEHVEFLLNQFLPCKNYLQIGLKHLVPLDKLTSGYLGIRFVYESGKVTFEIVKGEQSSNEYTGYERNSTCGYFKVNFATQLDNQQQKRVSVERVSLSKWYNPQKTIAFIISKTPGIIAEDSLHLYTRLASGFVFKAIRPLSPQTQFTYSIENQKDGAVFVQIALKLQPLSPQTIIHLQFEAGLPHFEKFQTTGAGGEEMITLTKVISGQREEYLYDTQLIAEQLMQPDFSISFKVITFSAATVLVLWLALWRNHDFSPEQSSLE